MGLISFHNDPAVKEKYLSRVRDHAAADEIIKGTYWQDGKGCAVGCTIHSGDHKAYEKELGIPEWLARIEDKLFESLPNNKAKEWPEKFLSAIPIGVNLDPVKWKFSIFILKENIDRVLALKGISDELKKQVVDSIRGVLALHEKIIETGEEDRSAWSAARSAESAARSAARSAAASAAWSAESAAESAAASAAWSAESAAWSAESAARSAASAASAESAESAESAAYERYAEELLRLLRESK